MPDEADLAWAKKQGWIWDGSGFVPETPIKVIPNPLGEGWCPWHAACGAIQTDAPFSSVRAAIRVAEKIRSGRELDCRD